jgi:dihydrolipoamide dehydrogenase
MIAEGALAIGLDATLDDIVNTIHAHPTVSEAVREAALAAMGRAIHILN